MDIVETTRLYERWLGEQTDIIRADLQYKHEQMALGVFAFMRATFYRWTEQWLEHAGDLTDAPIALSVGDLHVENFGTWRDQEGRLVWGVNDFDEAFPLPYTQDLVRLATSAHLAIETEHLTIKRGEACDAILDGYAAAMTAGGKPFVLAEDHDWLRRIALGKLRDPAKFWAKLEALPSWRKAVPPAALRAMQNLLSEASLEVRVVHRVAGLGSLGRQRFVALADWSGGKVARECKALVPSACTWALKRSRPARSYYQRLLDSAVRVPDPFVRVLDKWVMRRLAPDCARIELSDLPEGRDEYRLLYAMGYEVGNIHLGTKDLRKGILRNLRHRPAKWLHRAAKRMTALVVGDWKAWPH